MLKYVNTYHCYFGRFHVHLYSTMPTGIAKISIIHIIYFPNVS